MIPRRLQYAVVALVLAIFAMSGYLVYLKRKAESIAAPPPSGSLSAPLSGPAAELTLYLPSDADGTLRALVIAQAQPTDPGERARLALHTLIARWMLPESSHPLGAGADVHDVFLFDASSAVVNLNAAFADGHRSGIAVEQLSLFSMVLTLKAQFPQLTRVRFLVDGKQRDTLAGHADLASWYDVQMVAEAAASLK